MQSYGTQGTTHIWDMDVWVWVRLMLLLGGSLAPLLMFFFINKLDSNMCAQWEYLTNLQLELTLSCFHDHLRSCLKCKVKGFPLSYLFAYSFTIQDSPLDIILMDNYFYLSLEVHPTRKNQNPFFLALILSCNKIWEQKKKLVFNDPCWSP